MLKVLLVCRSCGYSKESEGSDESVPGRCPSCGSTDLEFVVYRDKSSQEEETRIDSGGDEKLASLIEEAFLKQVSEGEWEIDLTRTISEDVAIAELEPGEYEILFKLRRVESPSSQEL